MNANQLLAQRYQLIKLLGAGGMSQAYLAEDIQRPSRPLCVVKQLKPLTQDPKMLATARVLFDREADVLEQLGHHPQIPQLLAHFEENQEFYLVEEFVEGTPLGAELQLGQPWNEDAVIQLLLEILPVLEFIHSQKVIHRDIKPANIIRRRSDFPAGTLRERQLVLIDFGAVRQIETNLTMSHHVTSGTVVGTYGYMPTEQSHGTPRPNSDIYALGIVCIQALTGLLPTQLPRDLETGEICWQHFIPVSHDLAAILNQMVRYHFRDRYQTAAEVLQAVQTLIAKRQAPPVTRPQRQPTRKRRAAVGIGALAVASALAGSYYGISANVPSQLSFGGDRVLDVGVLTTPKNNRPENYEQLRAYLQQRFGSQVEVKLHPIDLTAPQGIERAKQEIKTRRWDVAFTTLPLLSASAVDNQYQFAAQMVFPVKESPKSAIFVRQDSPIRSLDDLTANKTIALGGFNQASSFYQPVYDLYGKTLRVNLNNTAGESIKKVLSKQADVGAGPLFLVEKEPDLRVLHVSRDLPTSGVYLSPNLSVSERQLITQSLLQAPAPIQEQARYKAGAEIDYSEFLKIVRRVEEVTSCTNWQLNPVPLFCHEISGKIEGYSSVDLAVRFTFKGDDGKTYRLVIPRTVLDRDPNLDSPGAINFKRVTIAKVPPLQVDGVLELRLSEPGQLKLLS